MANELFAVGIPTLAVLVGILINNSRLSDLKSHMDVRFQATDRRIEDTRELLRSELRRVEEIMDARLSRIEQERSNYLQLAAMDLVREILPILDDFERALNVKTADRNYAKGVELIYQRLFETVKKMGLEPIETAGKAFDPNLHQAVERVPAE